MKRFRMLILVVVIIAALTAVAIPALAADPFYTGNWSFEADVNGDGHPDKWNVKGAVYRLCDHGYATYDDCMMVFPPSNKGAAVWQRYNSDGSLVVVTGEEVESTYLGQGVFGAKNFDSYRAYFGYRIVYPGGENVLLYDDIPGGTYPFTNLFFSALVGSWGKDLGDDIYYGNIDHLSWGVMVLPGDGTLGVDWIWSVLAL
jgi:hypothetical protein